MPEPVNSGKVIPFPKTKRPPAPPEKSNFMKVIVGSLVLVTAISGILNKVIFNFESRSMASMAGVRDAHDDQRLAERLAFAPKRGLASVGTHPGDMEELQFGPLNGQYRMNLLAGKLVELALIENGKNSPEPIQIKEKPGFLVHHKNKFALDFQSIGKKKVTSDENGVEETFPLLKSGSQVGQAKFILNSQGRLISLRILEGPAK